MRSLRIARIFIAAVECAPYAFPHRTGEPKHVGADSISARDHRAEVKSEK